MTKAALAAAGSVTVLVGLGWLGLQVKPAPPAPHPESTSGSEVVELPPNLPQPVRRYYLATADGGGVPKTGTAVVWGRGEFSLNGLWFPARFEAYYDVPDRAFRRDMDLTWFGMPLFRGRDTFAGGKGSTNVTGLFGLVDTTFDGEKVDQGANLAMWGEILCYAPPALLRDKRIRWETIDGNTARLVVPFGGEEDSLRVEFDPETGLMRSVSGMRYRGEEREKTPWRGETSWWKAADGRLAPHRITATWEDQGEPYVVLDLEGAAFGADVPDGLFRSGGLP